MYYMPQDDIENALIKRRMGLGQAPAIIGGFSLQTVLLILGGGVVLYWLVAGKPAKQRRAKLREAREEYQSKRREIKRTYKRWGVKQPRAKGRGKVIVKPGLTDTERDVISALVGQGANKGAAIETVKRAAAKVGTNDFDKLLRVALSETRGRKVA